MDSTLLLHPDYFNPVIFLFLLPLAIFQWVAAFLLAKENNVLNSIDSIECKYKIPFTKDNFFIVWNLLPVFLILLYWYISIKWSDWRSDFLVLNNKELLEYYDCIYKIRFEYYITIIFILLFLSLPTVILQFKKQKQFIKNGSFAYWWDIRISKIIFFIRIIALFFNMFSIVYVLFSAIMLSYFIYKVIGINDLNLVFFHPDNSGGLKSIGDLSIVLGGVFLFTSGTGLVGIFDHKFKQGMPHTITDILCSLMIIPALFIIIIPAHKNMDTIEKKFSDVGYVYSKFLEKSYLNSYYQDISKIKNNNNLIEFEKWINDNYAKFIVLRQMLNIENFPLNLTMLITFITTWFIPFFIWIFIKNM